MEQSRKPHIIYHSIKLGVYTILAILVGIFRLEIVEYLKFFIASLMIFYACEEILFDFMFSRKNFLHKIKVYLGIGEIIISVSLFFIDLSYIGVCVTWAIWSILREALELEEIIAELKAWFPRILSLIETLTVFVFSVMLIAEPTEHHALIHIYLLIVELVLNPLTPLLDEIIRKYKKKASKN